MVLAQRNKFPIDLSATTSKQTRSIENIYQKEKEEAKRFRAVVVVVGAKKGVYCVGTACEAVSHS